jgi:hypothetical protein
VILASTRDVGFEVVELSPEPSQHHPCDHHLPTKMADVVPASPKRRRLNKAGGHEDRSGSSSDSAAATKHVSPGERPSQPPTKAPPSGPELPPKRASGLRRTPMRPTTANLTYQMPKLEPETEKEKQRRVAEALLREDEAKIKELQQEIARLERIHGTEREKDTDALMYSPPPPPSRSIFFSS